MSHQSREVLDEISNERSSNDQIIVPISSPLRNLCPASRILIHRVTKHIKKRDTPKRISDRRKGHADRRILAFTTREMVSSRAAMRSPVARRNKWKRITLSDDRTTRSASGKSQRRCPAVVVARGEPLTASANSTPFPVHPHPLYTTTYTSIPTTWASPLSSTHPFLNDRRRKRHNPAHPPLRGGFEAAVSVVLPARPRCSFAPPFAEGRAYGALFSLLMALSRFLFQTLSCNLDSNLEEALF